ncbi:MAG: PSD1 and planctomycete cytochrome C domain-containing protein [Planctomycetota bacterium]
MSRSALAFTFAAALVIYVAGDSSEFGLVATTASADEVPAVVATLGKPASASPLYFETHVRPLLKAHCWQCHGEEEKPEAGLDLRLVRFISKGGESGPAIAPGQPDASLIWKRVSADEMPPGKKKLSPQERSVLREWLAQGAKTARAEPDAVPAESPWTDEERSHWAFQPVQRPSVPAVARPELVASPVDAFLLKRLEAGQDGTALAYSPQADRLTLLRRVHIDLLGLPPTPELVERWLSDSSPDAWEKLIDELLDSPRYGERWGRHWLDVAGYADSDGYTEVDPVRPWSFKYRDYVVSAFNDDKPFDRFVVEQLAGDELLAPPYQNLSRDQTDCLTATGFLRMGPDGTGGGVDQNIARNEVVAETIKITSTALLGVSIGCAQCHSHRYDPISQVDYYRFRALFEPAYDWKNWKPPSQRLVNLWSPADHEQAAAVDKEVAVLEGGRVKEFDKLVAEVYERELAKLDDELREAARDAKATKKEKRTDFQKQLLKDYPSLEVNHGTISLFDPARTTEISKLYEKLKGEARAKRPKDDFVACLTEPPGHLPTTAVFYRGDINQSKQTVTPAELSVIGSSPVEFPVDDPQLPTSGRRLAYARHLTNGRHPLLARVFVNRVWMHHFGRGLVSTPADFGVLGDRPSHPELLNWLADEFVRGGWQLKRLHRLLVNSTAYRQSSLRTDPLQLVDPDNRLLARMSVRRLEAEAIRDAILAVSGRLSDKLLGPAVSVLPDADGQNIVGRGERDGNGILIGKQDGLGEDEFRRSIYVQVRRSMPLGMLEPFDLAGMAPNCERRTFSTVAPQSLLMMNNDFLVKQSEAFARRIEETSASEPSARIQRAWQLAYGRIPTETESTRATEFLTLQTAYFDEARAKLPEAERPKQTPPTTQALALLCQALLSSNAFLYVD